MIGDSEAITLSYAQRPRRRWVRSAVRLCLLAVLAGAIWWNWGYLHAQAQARWKIYQVYRAQTAWLDSAPPPDQLVYADEPVGPEPPPYPDAPFPDFVWEQVLTPQYLTNGTLPFVRVTSLYQSSAFANFRSVSETIDLSVLRQSVPHRALAFSGERITPAGVRCVVAVEVDAAGLVITGWTRSRITQPGKLFIHPQMLVLDRGLWSHQFRVLAGRADDTDPSRFTLQCQVGQRRAVITGRLLDTHRIEFSVPGRLDQYDEMVDAMGLPVVIHFWRALGRDARPVAWQETPRRVPLGDGKDALAMQFVSASEIAIAYPGRIDVRRLSDGAISRTSIPQEPLVHGSGHTSYVIDPETRNVARRPDHLSANRCVAAQFLSDQRHVIRIDRNDLVVDDLSTIQAFDAAPR